MADAERAGPMVVGPVTLEGRLVRLEPLARGHLDGLCAAGLQGDVFRWMPTPIDSREEMAAWVDAALEAQAAGTALPLATVHRRLEIGWTWVGRPWQRTPINTEAKLLMLRHAFETLGANRVELKTDALNAPSRAAILRLGAAEEGTFRSHMILPGGRVRDTVYYSLIAPEWPAVRDRLGAMLDRPWPRP